MALSKKVMFDGFLQVTSIYKNHLKTTFGIKSGPEISIISSSIDDKFLSRNWPLN